VVAGSVDAASDQLALDPAQHVGRVHHFPMQDHQDRLHGLVRGWQVVETVCPLPVVFEELERRCDLPELSQF